MAQVGETPACAKTGLAVDGAAVGGGEPAAETIHDYVRGLLTDTVLDMHAMTIQPRNGNSAHESHECTRTCVAGCEHPTGERGLIPKPK